MKALTLLIVILFLVPACGSSQSKEASIVAGATKRDGKIERVVFFVANPLVTNVTEEDLDKLKEPQFRNADYQTSRGVVTIPDVFAVARTKINGRMYPVDYWWMIKDYELADAYARDHLPNTLWIRINNPSTGELAAAWNKAQRDYPQVSDRSVAKMAFFYGHGVVDEQGKLVLAQVTEHLGADGALTEERRRSYATDWIRELADAVGKSTIGGQTVDFAIHACYAGSLHAEPELRKSPNVGSVVTGSAPGSLYVGDRKARGSSTSISSMMLSTLLEAWKNPRSVLDIDLDAQITFKDIAYKLQQVQLQEDSNYEIPSYAFYLPTAGGSMSWFRHEKQDYEFDPNHTWIPRDQTRKTAKLMKVLVDGKPTDVYVTEYTNAVKQTVIYSDPKNQAPQRIQEIVSRIAVNSR